MKIRKIGQQRGCVVPASSKSATTSTLLAKEKIYLQEKWFATCRILLTMSNVYKYNINNKNAFQ